MYLALLLSVPLEVQVTNCVSQIIVCYIDRRWRWEGGGRKSGWEKGTMEQITTLNYGRHLNTEEKYNFYCAQKQSILTTPVHTITIKFFTPCTIIITNRIYHAPFLSPPSTTQHRRSIQGISHAVYYDTQFRSHGISGVSKMATLRARTVFRTGS
jgi:hypothetical protein